MNKIKKFFHVSPKTDGTPSNTAHLEDLPVEPNEIDGKAGDSSIADIPENPIVPNETDGTEGIASFGGHNAHMVVGGEGLSQWVSDGKMWNYNDAGNVLFGGTEGSGEVSILPPGARASDAADLAVTHVNDQ